MAILLFLLATRDRAMWQWLTLDRRCRLGGGAAALHAVHLVGWRRPRRQSLFPRHLRRLPVPGAAAANRDRRPRRRWRSARCSSSTIISNPFYATRHPQEHSEDGTVPLAADRVDDGQRPADQRRAESRFGSRLAASPPMLAYFIDDNVFNREGDAFWVRGESSADILLRAPIQPEADAAGVPESRVTAHQQADRDSRDRSEARSHRHLDRRRPPHRRHGAELAADDRARDAARHAVQVRSAIPDQLHLHDLRSAHRPDSCRCSRTARTTADSSA